MEKKIFNLDYEKAESIAKKHFIGASELGSNIRNHQMLLDEAMHVLLCIKPKISLKALVIPLSSDSYFDSAIHMEKNIYSCTAFEQIPSTEISRIYAYFLSLGEQEGQSENQLDQYYVNLWENSFFEAGREIIKDKIKTIERTDEKGQFISCPFGPGFYGMAPIKLSSMLEEIDYKEAVDKLCGGFFFITNCKEVLPPIECKDCIGHDKGCLFCGGNNIIPSRETCIELLHLYKTPPHVIRHCIAVSDTALRIGNALISKGMTLNIALLEAASLLHDIARVEENHGLKGAAVLEKYGYRQVAKLVKCHMFYATNPYKNEITEMDILCLADRMVKEDKYVGIDVRMQSVLNKLNALGIDTKRVHHRIRENKILKDRIEKIIGKSVDSLMT